MTAPWLEFEGRRYAWLWLRDNCPCAACRHPTSFQKLYDFSDAPAPPRPAAVELGADAISVTWAGAPPHASTYPHAWLRAHGAEPPQAPPAPRWTAADIATWPPSRHPLPAVDPDGGPWVADMAARGFALFEGVTYEGFDAFLSAIGPIHHTEYGRYAPVRAKAGAHDLAETGHALSPHTDYSTYMHTAPLLQVMYFEANDATGGESILVDGFAVADALQREDPAAFDMLCDVPVEHGQTYTGWRYTFLRRRPVLERGPDGRVAGVYFGHSHAEAWRLPFDLVEPYYAAYGKLFRLLKDPRFQYRFRSEAGTAIAVQNARVLHGRAAFDASTGDRGLLVGYVAWEHFEARQRHLRAAAALGAPS